MLLRYHKLLESYFASLLALALKHSETADSNRRLFTNDLFPATSVIEEYFHFTTDVNIIKTSYSHFYNDILDRPGGQLHALYANLHMNSLNERVVIIAGEALPLLDYGLVWSDAAHSTERVLLNAPYWLRVCDVQPGSIVVWGFHYRTSESGKREIADIFTAAGHRVLNTFSAGLIYAMELKCKSEVFA